MICEELELAPDISGTGEGGPWAARRLCGPGVAGGGPAARRLCGPGVGAGGPAAR